MSKVKPLEIGHAMAKAKAMGGQRRGQQAAKEFLLFVVVFFRVAASFFFVAFLFVCFVPFRPRRLLIYI